MSAEDLAKVAKERRLELRLRQRDLEATGGPSAGTVANIEQGSRDIYSGQTFAALDRSLRWRPGSASAVFAIGEQPVTAAPPDDSPAWMAEDERAKRIGYAVQALLRELNL